jgi:hypothetical protein
MPVTVPSDVRKYIQQAADGTQLSFNVVACQVNEESGFNAGAVSPTGAQGPYQFEPGTWASYGQGSPFNWADSTLAYIRFMILLLRMFNGNVRDALAAYNAGPGNIGAGMGYADTILACSGGAVNVGIQAAPSIGTYQAPPRGGGSGDDWSQKVRNCADQINFAGTNMLSAANGIMRM